MSRRWALPLVLLACAFGPASAHAQVQAGSKINTQPQGTGTTRRAVSVRDSPGGKVVGKLAARRRVTLTCQQNGPLVRASAGATRIWDRIRFRSTTAFVSDSALVTTPASPGGLVAAICGAPVLSSPAPGATQGACGVTSPAPLAAPFTSVKSFIKAAVPGAQTSQRETRVPTSVTLAQAILESGYGTATAGANNYFGIKAVLVSPGIYRWATIAVGCVLRKTQEFSNGHMATEIGAFRAYTGLKDSIRDHGSLLVTNPVYAAAFDHTDDPKRFARIIATHYATDPNYASSLLKLMSKYKLQHYDLKVANPTTGPTGPSGPTPPATPGVGVPAP